MAYKLNIFTKKFDIDTMQSLTTLDSRYVNVTGDTMTGNLNMGTYVLIGGTGITDVLKLQSTTGNGTLTSPAIQLLTGNNGATTAVTVLNNGNVGIGTTSPLSKFEVNGDVATLRIVDNVTRTPTLDLIRGTGAFGSDVYGDWRIQNNTAKLNFVNYASTSGERTYLTLDGSTSAATGVRIGINTATPAAPLDIEGTNFPVYRTVRNVTATTGFNSTNIFVTKTTGNAEDGLGGGLVFGFQDDTQVTDSYLASIGAVRDGGDTKGALVLFTYNNIPQERMRITNTGNVGIGTTSPSGRLHINGTVDEEQLIVRAHSTQTANLQVWQDSSGNALAYVNQVGTGKFVEINTTGNITLDGTGNAFMILDRNATTNFAAFQFKTTGVTKATVGIYNTATNNLVFNLDSADAGRRQTLILKPNSEAVFNDEGGNMNFRVESDTEENMLFLDSDADTDGALYLGGTTNGIEIKKGGVLTFLGTANISGGASGSFTTTDGKTVTVTGGIITAIV